MDPLSKLFLVVVIGVPILTIVAIFALWKLYKHFAENRSSKSQPKTQVSNNIERFSAIPKNKDIYYEVKKIRANTQTLTQYVKFLIMQNNEFIDVTEQVKREHPNLTKYTGRSDKLKGTVALTDYDIVRLQKELGLTSQSLINLP